MSLIETKNDLLKDLRIEEVPEFPVLDYMAAGETKYLKDLRINLKNALGSENFSLKEGYLIALSIASSEGNDVLQKSFIFLSKENSASDAEIAEALACASMLSVNNVFYRFRHFLNNETYNTMPAGIKMNVMMNPVLGKELFELISLAVSAVNGCQNCVNSHEASLRKLNTSQQRIFDAIRLASIIRGLSVVIH